MLRRFPLNHLLKYLYVNTVPPESFVNFVDLNWNSETYIVKFSSALDIIVKFSIAERNKNITVVCCVAARVVCQPLMFIFSPIKWSQNLDGFMKFYSPNGLKI